MTGEEQFRYDGRRAVVVGGATGMGAAAARLLAELGADVARVSPGGLYLATCFPLCTKCSREGRLPMEQQHQVVSDAGSRQ